MPGIRATASALAAVCAVGLAACGSDDGGTIPQDAGDRLLAQLDDVEQAVEAGECDTARSAAVGFNTLVNELSSDVDPEVRDALLEGGGNLATLADDPEQCESVEIGPSGETSSTEQTPPAAETPEEETPAEETPEEETPPPDEETPPDDGGDGNQGKGNGGEPGGGGGDSSGGGIGSEG